MISDLRRDIKKAWRTVAAREKAPYDGVIGTPPEWLVSARELKKFFLIREELLAQHSHQFLLDCIRETLEHSRCNSQDKEFVNKIIFLTEIWYAANRETKEEGISFLNDPIRAGDVIAGRKQKYNLAKGPPVAAKNKSEKSDKLRKQCEVWALELWKNAPPWWGSDDVLDKVYLLVNEHKYTMANGKRYSKRRIGDFITGTKESLKKKK